VEAAMSINSKRTLELIVWEGLLKDYLFIPTFAMA
jgi:hypothetical protein